MSSQGRSGGRTTSARLAAALGLALVLAVIVVAPGASGPAGAQSDDELAVQVELGYGDVGAADAWTPVTVTFRPDRPISGRVEVVSSTMQGERIAAQPVEVAAGAPVAVRLVVPPGRISARVVAGGDVVASTRPRSVDAPGLVIGVLGAGEVDGPSVEVLPLGVSGRWVGVDRAWVEVPRGLASLDALVLPRGAWSELDESARAAIWAEVALGGMVLVAADEVDAAALPRPVDPVDPGADAHVVAPGTGHRGAVVAPAGLGRVALVPGGAEGARDGELWAVVVGPRGVVDPIADAEVYDTQPFAARDLLLAGGGIGSVAGIPRLGLFLLAYLLVVGPANVLLLRRLRRPELAWVTVPAIALVFAAVPLVLTRPAGSDVPLRGQALTWWVEGAGQERLAAAWQVGSTGATRALLEGGDWTALHWGDTRGGSVEPDADGVAIRGEARVGEIVGVVGTRVAGGTAPLVVDARVDGGDVVVDVGNDGPRPVLDVVVVVGNQTEPIGDLDPGEQRTTVLPGRLVAAHLNAQATREPVDGVRSSAAVTGDGGPAGGAVIGGTAEQVVVVGPGFDQGFGQGFPMDPFFGGGATGLFPGPPRFGVPGLAWAIGTDDHADPPLAVDGVQILPGARTIAVGSRITADAPVARVPVAAVLAQPVLDESDMPVNPTAPFGQARDGSRPVLRIHVPPLATTSRLAAGLAGMSRDLVVQVWDARARIWRDVASDAADLDPASLLTATGELYVRATGPLDGAGVAVVQPGDAAVPRPLDGPPGFPTAEPPIPLPQPTFADPILPSPAEGSG